MRDRMTNATATAIKMLETLPEETQEYVVERMREAIRTFQDEIEWENLYEKKKGSLAKTARKVRQQTRAGKIEEMDYDKL